MRPGRDLPLHCARDFASALRPCAAYRRAKDDSALCTLSSTQRSYSLADGSALFGCCSWHVRRAVETARPIRMSLRSKRSWRAKALAQPTVMRADATTSARMVFIAVSPFPLVITMCRIDLNPGLTAQMPGRRSALAGTYGLDVTVNSSGLLTGSSHQNQGSIECLRHGQIRRNFVAGRRHPCRAAVDSARRSICKCRAPDRV